MIALFLSILVADYCTNSSPFSIYFQTPDICRIRGLSGNSYYPVALNHTFADIIKVQYHITFVNQIGNLAVFLTTIMPPNSDLL